MGVVEGCTAGMVLTADDTKNDDFTSTGLIGASPSGDGASLFNNEAARSLSDRADSTVLVSAMAASDPVSCTADCSAWITAVGNEDGTVSAGADVGELDTAGGDNIT